MMMLSVSGWEVKILKKMGRKILVHYRGCEIRDWRKNMKLHPELNICQDCDYGRIRCDDWKVKQQRKVFAQYADKSLVTTPDLLDFAPDAEYFPFFAPEISPCNKTINENFHIVMVSNHPGIDGLREVENILKELVVEGYSFTWEVLYQASMEKMKQSLEKADLAIGKMKMGFYANAQIESMMMGIPTVSYVRDDFLGRYQLPERLILSTLSELKSKIKMLLEDKNLYDQVSKKTRDSVLEIHNNQFLAERLKNIYTELVERNNYNEKNSAYQNN